MDRDSLADLPADSRREIVAAVCAVLDVEAATAEDLVRSAEPLWDAMERAGGSSTLGAEASSATDFRASWRSSGRVWLTPDHGSSGRASTAHKPSGLSHIKRSRCVAHQVELGKEPSGEPSGV